MSDRWQELAVFLRVAEGGSFSRAGRELGLSQPSVSRIVGELEARLGVKLLLRTTRSLSLTDAGLLFVERARQIMADWEAAEDAARGIDSLHGVIRIALPVMYGTRAVIPCLPRFLERHPALRIEIGVSDERQNLIADGADVAIRVGTLGDSTFGARRLDTLRRMLAAAPAYLERKGVPQSPADLAVHDCILGPGGFGRASWNLRRDGASISVDVGSRIEIASAPGMVAAVAAGLGIGMISDVMAADELASGRIVPLLPDYEMSPIEVHAVFPGGPRPSAKVRAFVDFLAAELPQLRAAGQAASTIEATAAATGDP